MSTTMQKSSILGKHNYVYVVKGSAPREWTRGNEDHALTVLSFSSLEDIQELEKVLNTLFKDERRPLPVESSRFIFRSYLPGVSNPVAESLSRAIGIESRYIRIDQALALETELSSSEEEMLNGLWREPAIEFLQKKPGATI